MLHKIKRRRSRGRRTCVIVGRASYGRHIREKCDSAVVIRRVSRKTLCPGRARGYISKPGASIKSGVRAAAGDRTNNRSRLVSPAPAISRNLRFRVYSTERKVKQFPRYNSEIDCAPLPPCLAPALKPANAAVCSESSSYEIYLRVKISTRSRRCAIQQPCVGDGQTTSECKNARPLHNRKHDAVVKERTRERSEN